LYDRPPGLSFRKPVGQTIAFGGLSFLASPAA
jgi:hypothetical protein